MSKSNYAVAAIIALAALAGAVGTAQAGGKHRFHFNNFNNFKTVDSYDDFGSYSSYGIKSLHRHPRLRIVIGGGGVGYGSGCEYLYDKWLLTGRSIWKRKFLLCKGLL